jgi:hypothetical protein
VKQKKIGTSIELSLRRPLPQPAEPETMKLQTCCFNDGRQRPLRFPYQSIGAFAATTNLQYALPDRLQTGEFLLNRGRGRGVGKATDDLAALDPKAELVDGPVASLFGLHKTLSLERFTVLVF